MTELDAHDGVDFVLMIVSVLPGIINVSVRYRTPLTGVDPNHHFAWRFLCDRNALRRGGSTGTRRVLRGCCGRVESEDRRASNEQQSIFQHGSPPSTSSHHHAPEDDYRARILDCGLSRSSVDAYRRGTGPEQSRVRAAPPGPVTKRGKYSLGPTSRKRPLSSERLAKTLEQTTKAARAEARAAF